MPGKIVKLETHPSRCVGCLLCQLICSFSYEKMFNPSKARIAIERGENGTRYPFSNSLFVDDDTKVE